MYGVSTPRTTLVGSKWMTSTICKTTLDQVVRQNLYRQIRIDMFKDEMEEFSRLPATRAEPLSTIKDKTKSSQVQQPQIKTTVLPKHMKGAPLSPQKTPLSHSSLITPTYLLIQSLNQNSAQRSQAQSKGPQPQRSDSKILIQTNDKRTQQGEYQINSIPQKNGGGQQQRGSSRTKAPTKATKPKQALASVNSSKHTPSSSQVNISKSTKKLTYLTQNTSPQPTSKVFDSKQASVNASLSQLSKLRQCLSANTSPVRTLNKAPKPQQGSPVIASFKKIQQNIKQQRQLSPSSQVKETMATSNQDTKSPRTHVSSAANKYMKNASKLQSVPQLGSNATQSHLQKIKSFLSPAACQMKSQRTMIQNSSLARSLNSTKNISRPTSQERICIDLSQNNLNTQAFIAASSPQPSPKWQSLMKTSTKQHHSRDHYSNKQQSLNSAVYETLVMQKTSMLKKTISDMGGSDIENIPSKMNSQKSKVSDYNPIQNLKKGSNLRTSEKSGQKSAATLRVNLASTQNRSKLRTALCSSTCSSYKV